MMRRTVGLLGAWMRYTAEEIVRGRRRYFVGVLGVMGATGAWVAWGAAGGGTRAGLLSLGFWVVGAPFCGSWIEEDVRLAHAGWWLQKPVGTFQLYLARLVSVAAWAAAASLAVWAATLPGLLAAEGLSGAVGTLLAMGWVPVMLVALSTLGSGLGARNGALFAYGVLFASLGVGVLLDTNMLHPRAYGVLSRVLPPVYTGFDAAAAYRGEGLIAGLAALGPVFAYTTVAAGLGLLLALRVPGRLGRSER
jgi:hypothetical protein